MTSIDSLPSYEYSRSYETIFPLESLLLEKSMRVFEASTEAFLRLVVEARGEWGAASSLYTNMPRRQLIEWHETESDFETSSELYYKAGLLYGMDVAKRTRMARDPMAVRLKADDPRAFDEALDYMKETYRLLDDTMERGAERQVAREQKYTGSSILADAALMQHERLLGNTSLAETDDNDITALHVGMVDGVIFVDAYSAFTHGRRPQVFA